MGSQQPPKLKLQPLPIEKQDRALVSKYLGTHHCASATPFWHERVAELRHNQTKTRLKPSDFHPRKLISFNQPFGEVHSGLTYQMLHPNPNPNPKQANRDENIAQFTLSSYKLNTLARFLENHPGLGLTIEQLLQMRLSGGSNTGAWLKNIIIQMSGGLNPNCRYGSLAHGYGEPDQINRLVQQESMGKSPDLEPKLVQDCKILGLTPTLVEHYTPTMRQRPEEGHTPRLVPSCA